MKEENADSNLDRIEIQHHDGASCIIRVHNTHTTREKIVSSDDILLPLWPPAIPSATVAGVLHSFLFFFFFKWSPYFFF